MPTIGDLVTSAFTEIRMARAGDVLSPEDMAWGLYVFNRLLDLWNADRRAVYNETFTDVTLTPSLSPHTIGPGGTFVVTQRPVTIEAIAINLGSNLYTPPLNVRDAAWYQAQSAPALTSPLPTDFYFDPAWPLGKIYFWPVPTTAYGVRVWVRGLLAAVLQTDTFTLPPGYQAALELTLAEEIAASCGQTASPSTTRRAKNARATVFGDNDVIPDLITADAGMPRASGGGFDYRTGLVS